MLCETPPPPGFCSQTTSERKSIAKVRAAQKASATSPDRRNQGATKRVSQLCFVGLCLRRKRFCFWTQLGGAGRWTKAALYHNQEPPKS